MSKLVKCIILFFVLITSNDPVSATEPGPIQGDMLIVPENIKINSAAPLQSYASGFYDTSEYMIGDIAVGIIFLESNGTKDINSEDWDNIEESRVVSEIKDGLNWWAAREPNAKLTFAYDIHYKLPTGYEPIKHPQSDESLWITDAMANLGYTRYPYFFDNVQDYDNAIRTKLNTDWAYTIFVVDSSNDIDGMFSDGYFAYAYLGGPFTVMTYKNDGYGIENMDAVIAHETGHIFYANDQYYEAQQPCTKITGYLAIENQNSAYPWGACLSNVDSIMRSQISPYTSGALDSYARQQVGWRDIDSDGILDIIDFNPSSTLNPYSNRLTNDNTPTYSGKSTITTTYPNNNPYGSRNAITINKIKEVQYRIDGGSWLSALPADGAFNSNIENFTFTAPAIPDGTHTFEVRALNTAGNWETAYANDTIIIDILTKNTNVIKNPGFESGKTSWSFYTNVAGPTFNVAPPGYEDNNSAKLAFSKIGTNMQLFQSGITLEPNTRYRLSFAGKSTMGHDIRVRLFKHVSPYPLYGLDYSANLDEAWTIFTTEFNTTGFTTNVTDGRLQFYLVPFAKAGDTYDLDNVVLEKVVAAPPEPPAVIGNAPTGTNVPVTASISINFSKPMDHASVQSAISTTPATNGIFSWSGNVMTYTPDSNLTYNTTYNVTVGTSAMDIAGNSLLAPYEWNFTTMDQDLTHPTVIDYSP
ncbi:MAG: Ig-like domain-containing protein, partial [Candidatus Methanoperedens sp.]